MKFFCLKKKVGVVSMLVGLFFFLQNEQLIAGSEQLTEFKVTITDTDGVPLIGVNVYTENESFTAVSDIDGHVLLKDIAYSQELIFSYIGFQTLKIPFFKIRQLGGKVTLRPALDLLPSVTVVGRRDEKPEEIPYQIGLIKKENIEEYNSQTTADALQQNENVFVQKSQMGGGSINIRGFEANKVLLVVDGVRMNNIVYRNGHLQDAIKVDNNALEQIEVIYGPGSLNYGSDALGGVVQFRTKEPKLYDGENPSKSYRSESNIMSRFSSANREKTFHADVNYGTETWGSFTSLSYSKFEHLKAGSVRPDAYPDFGSRYEFFERLSGEDVIRSSLDSNLQDPTGYSQFDFLQKIKIKSNQNQTWVFNFQYSTSSDVPRFDFLTDYSGGRLKWSEWYYGPQQRVFLSAKSQTFKRTSLFNKMTIIGAFQKIDEDRYKRKAFERFRIFNLEDIYALSLTADFQKNYGSKAALIYGLDANHNILYSTAGQIDINTQETQGGVMARYPSGVSDMTLLAGYVNMRFQSADSVFTAFGGFRYTWANLYGIYERRADDVIVFPGHFYSKGITATNGRLTWSIGATAHSKDGWSLKSSVSTSFHAPNIDDFAKFRAKGGKLRVPNPDLKPERTLSTELTVGKAFGRINSKDGSGALLEISGYYTLLKDGILQDEFTLLGDSIYRNESDNSDNDIVYEVVANVNKEEARIYGASGNFKIRLKKIELFSGAGYSIGRIIEDGEDVGPLDHIPPFFARGGIRFKNKFMQLSAVVRHNGWKHIEDYAEGEDNYEYATEDGTYAWTTFNFYSSFRLGKKVSIDASVENITDIHYRPFSSGVSAAGRNFIVSVRGNF